MRIEIQDRSLMSPPFSGRTMAKQHSWSNYLQSPLWIFLLLAVTLRVWLVLRSGGNVDGDEALVGIQAERILHGELPVYFYGQPYMGSLEAYLVALIFALAGPSAWALRAEPVLLSLVLVWLTWRLAAALADNAQLTIAARTIFMCSAAFFAAVLPLYGAIIQLHTLGGYIETFILMLLLLLLAVRLVQHWQRGATAGTLVLYWLAIGFCVGLGLWIDPLIISAVVAAAIWIISGCVTQIVLLTRRANMHWARALRNTLSKLLLALVALPAFLVGVLPALLWGLRHNWANVTYIIDLNSPTRTLSQKIAQTRYAGTLLLKCVAPRLLSGSVPRQITPLMGWYSVSLAFALACLTIALLGAGVSCVVQRYPLLQLRRMILLPTLFAVITCSAFCSNTVNTIVTLSPCNTDSIDRYASPLLLATPFLFAAAFAFINMMFQRPQPEALADVAVNASLPGSSRVA